MAKISVSEQMTEIFETYTKEVRDSIKTESAKAARDTAAKLRATSARKTGEYAPGWRSKRIGESGSVTYNATAPGLTHLLERGHVVKNGKGIVGRANGDHKIEEAEQWGADQYETRLLRRLQ